FVLADRYCMEGVRKDLEKFMINSDLSNLPFDITMNWVKAADATGSVELMAKLVDQLVEVPSDLLKCFKDLNEIVSAPTRIGIAEQ
ncbi:hypothetical protein PMAYCL1PPCAC_05528, partial [Pristionchus mayeri]